MRKLLAILLFTFFAEYASAQTMAMVAIKADGAQATCLKANSDITWTFSNQRTGKSVTDATCSDWYSWDDGWHYTINLQELEAAGAFQVGDKLILTLKVVSSTCLTNYTGTETYTFDGGPLQTPGNADGDAIINLEGLKPTIAVTGVSLCNGETGKTVKATFTNVPASMTGYTIDWGIAGITTSGAISASGATGAVAVAATASGTAKLKNASGTVVATSASYTVTVNPLPTITVTPAELCKGQAATFTSSITGTWTGLVTGSGTSKTYTCSTAGTQNYTVEVTTAAGCKSGSKTGSITVNDLPSVTLATAVDKKCVGATVGLTATASGGSGSGWAYTWTPASLSGAAPTSAALANGNNSFSVKVKDSKNCESSVASKTVTGYKPTTTLSASPTSVPNGGTATLTAGASGGVGSYTYTWTPSSLSGSTATTSPLTTATTFKVKATDAEGCEGNEASVTVNVSGGAFAISPADKTLCSSELPTTLSAGASGGSNTYSYEWTAPAGVVLSSTTVAAPSVANTSTPGTYTVNVKVKDTGTNVEKTGSLSLTIKKTPDLGAISATPASISAGESAQLSVASVDPASSTLTWTGGPLATSTGKDVSTGVISTPGSKTYKVEADNSGCKASKTVQLTITAVDPGTASLALTVDKQCAYPDKFLTITIVGGAGVDSYSFVLRDQSNNAVLTKTKVPAGTWTYQVLPTAAGTYKITDYKYEFSGVEATGTAPAPVTAIFDPVPTVYANEGHLANISQCLGEPLILKGVGEPGLIYTWDNGVTDGVAFELTASGDYTVTGKNPETGCENKSTVHVSLGDKPTVTVPARQEICSGDSVTLTATGGADAEVVWNNGVVNGVPFAPMFTATYEVTATDKLSGCKTTDTATVVVTPPTRIVYTSKNPRNIAIGKDVSFAVKAEGLKMTYQWQKKENGAWVNMADVTNSMPIILGSQTDSISLIGVPKTWDETEFRIIVNGDCGQDSTKFQLGVKECFDISIDVVMHEGILPDTKAGNKIDGWYCRGRRVAFKAVITSEEGYNIENAHYKWTIDGLELSEEHVSLESDTCILSWIPEYQEDDMVVKVCGYSDGACEEVCSRYLRLKAREYEKVSLGLLTSVDPDQSFCPGDTVDFWVVAKNMGDSTRFAWYNDIFHLPVEKSPSNELVSFSESKMRIVMGQEDTWMKVIATPSKEVCTEDSVYVEKVFLKKKQWVTPDLRIINNIGDTMACQGDSIRFTAVYKNAGAKPTFNWRKDVWDWGHGQSISAVLDRDRDMWVKCWLIPGKDVCYKDGRLVDSMIIRILENPTVVISADLSSKGPGDEIIIESKVTNMPVKAHYKWYLNKDYTLSNSDYPEYISSKLNQGDVIQCGVSGERICTSEVLSNQLTIFFGGQGRDTMITIYQGEKIHNLNMRRRGDSNNTIFRIAADGYPKWGVGSVSYNGLFSYTPNAGFVGSDVVKYEIVDKFDQTKQEVGYIYLSVMDKQRFFVPNIITPNGDGLNDTWKLDFLADYPNHRIMIYNRNGFMVYEASNYQNDWDGTGMTFSGYVSRFNLPNGIYTYVIDLGNKEVLKNWIEIRRDMNRGSYRY